VYGTFVRRSLRRMTSWLTSSSSFRNTDRASGRTGLVA
jgi:hypothetical protein